MPPKKRKNIGQVQPNTKSTKVLRTGETSEEREQRLARNRERSRASRASETSEERVVRLHDMRGRAATARASEAAQERVVRLHDMRKRARTSRAATHFTLMLEGFHYDRHKDYMQHPNVTIGGMEKLCCFCNAKKFKLEPPGMCCRNGKVQLPQLESPPDDLSFYMSGATSESKHFLKNIRRYNSCFQMTSFGATSIVEQPGFATTFTVQGQVYHKVGSLLTPPDQRPKFLQLYFMGDEQLEMDQRCDHIRGVRREIVLNLQRMFHQHNYLIKTFKTNANG
mgnify:CR=1 FL=1